MTLEVNITETVTPKDVADSIFNSYSMHEIKAAIDNETECEIDNADCSSALYKKFNNFTETEKNKWILETLKELVKNIENNLDNLSSL